eukprot:Ihof_evm3s571 gene=Ihof_evmTU3s571
MAIPAINKIGSIASKKKLRIKFSSNSEEEINKNLLEELDNSSDDSIDRQSMTVDSDSNFKSVSSTDSDSSRPE